VVGIGRLRRRLLLALIPVVLAPSSAAAETFTPTTTADGDNGACTPNLAPGTEKTIRIGLRPTKRKGKLTAKAEASSALDEAPPAPASATVKIKRKRR
jgi:hypothetical protein